MVVGQRLSLENVPDTSSHTFHVCHADFLALPRNADTTSHPLNAWKNGRPPDFSGPIVETMSWIGIHLEWAP